MTLQEQPKKKKKIKVPKVVNGQDTLVEIEVDDVAGPSWGPKDAHTILNHNIERVDGPAKVTGMAKYTYDVRPEGLLYGRILRSPHAAAEVLDVNLAPAQKMQGVKAVIKLAPDKVIFEGMPIAAVAALTPEIAEDALRAIIVKYKKLPHAVTHTQAIAPNAPKVGQDKNAKGNVADRGKRGDKAEAEAALRTADVVVEREFLILMQHHVCLETHGVTVDFRGDDKATVYASTQGTFTIPGDAARELGLNEKNVEAVVEYMGGGFGSKFGLDVPGMVACRLSKEAKAPVKVMLTRADEFLMAGTRNGAWQKVKAGCTRDGKLVALVGQQFQLGGIGDGGLAGLPYVYDFPKTHNEASLLYTNQDSSRAMRGPGHPQASFATEAIIDDLAAKIGMDPIEFRKKNLSDRAYHRQLDMGAEAIRWAGRPKIPGGGVAYGPYRALKRGIGCGVATWGGGGGPSCQVDVFVKPDGSVAVQVGTQDLGTGSRTLTAGIVAEEFGLPVKAVETRIGRSTYGNANPSGGSTTTASLSPAVKDAAYNAKMQLFARVAPLLDAKPEDLLAQNGKVYSNIDPKKALTWKQACATLGTSTLSVRGVWKPGLGGAGIHGVQFAEVEVDVETGHVRVIKMVGVQDCGLAINRRGVQSQLNGGMIQSIGYALLEQHWVDPETGNMLNPTLDEYKIPGCMEMPEMVALIDDGDTRDVPIGMAEPAAIPGAAAIANAVFNACGVRVTDLPITPDKILNGLAKRIKA